MRVLITGAGGLVGRALTKRLTAASEVFPMFHRDLDITNEESVRSAVSSINPDLIINCAVTGVDECERDPEMARCMNVYGPAFLAKAASSVGAEIVHFSSNYVFSGDRSDGGFYSPDDVAEPINEYGRSKLEGEKALSAECPRSWIIRTSWVFGEGKQSFLATLPSRLEAGERVVAITDIFASATYVRDLARRVEELLALREYGVYHLNNSGVCTFADFASTTARIVGLTDAERDALLEYQTAASVLRDARRPRWTPMICSASERVGLSPLRSWQEALAAYIADSR